MKGILFTHWRRTQRVAGIDLTWRLFAPTTRQTALPSNDLSTQLWQRHGQSVDSTLLKFPSPGHTEGGANPSNSWLLVCQKRRTLRRDVLGPELSNSDYTNIRASCQKTFLLVHKQNYLFTSNSGYRQIENINPKFVMTVKVENLEA